jgi:hypothetical protein
MILKRNNLNLGMLIDLALIITLSLAGCKRRRTDAMTQEDYRARSVAVPHQCCDLLKPGPTDVPGTEPLAPAAV